MVRLCYVEKNSAIFLSIALITLANMCTVYKWESGITPKTPSGGHASVGTTQQSQRLALTDCAAKCSVSLYKSYFILKYVCS